MQESEMSHEFSVQIHKWITGKLDHVESDKLSAAKEKNKELEGYLSGQKDELLFFRKFLAEQIDLKTQTYYR
jgi:hypothetical protein